MVTPSEMSVSCERAVITLAASKPVYFDMAINLARSFVYWHRTSTIRFFIATDQPLDLPSDLHSVTVIRLKPSELGAGFTAKLHLDRLAPAQKTLFIDADCLCFGNLETVFGRFEGRAVSVVGGSISQGDWFGDVASLCARLGVMHIPKFNGGMYYVEKGELARRVYNRARQLQCEYDELRLSRLRGHPNDELLMAMAMALEGLTAVPDDGTVMSDPQACPGRLKVDVLRGRRRLVNPPPPDRRHRTWYPFTEVHPLVVHFLGDGTSTWQYCAEALALSLVLRYAIAAPIVWLSVLVLYKAPARCAWELKQVLRPLYHRLFGPRQVRPSPRV